MQIRRLAVLKRRLRCKAMEHAKAELQRAAEIAEHNAPISAAEGDYGQAALQVTVAHDCREAIAQLEESA